MDLVCLGILFAAFATTFGLLFVYDRLQEA
jgi:hypothetical protein